MNIEVKNSVSQAELYEEFKKYCKFYGESIQDNGVRSLTVQNGIDRDYSMHIDYIPVSSELSSFDDSLVVKDRASGVYSSVDQLLDIGYEMLGPESFRTKEEVENINYSNSGLEDLSVRHR